MHLVYRLLGQNVKPPKALNLSAANAALSGLDFEDPEAFHDFIFGKCLENNTFVGFGGYGEDRAIYQKRTHFGENQAEARTIHLGVDIWAEAETTVYTPWQGVVHSFRDNRQHGDYGPTIILEHRGANRPFYSLYGHLSRQSIAGLEIGRRLEAGQAVGALGQYSENGHWPPHLHYQVMLDIGAHHGDYPGVCSKADALYYLANCPDPATWACP